MHSIKSRRPTASMLVAFLALSVAISGVAAAAPTLMKLNKGKVVKIANQEINKRAPGLSVDKADTAANADALGGKALAQIQPVLAGDQSAEVVNVTPGGADVVSVNFTLAAVSRVNISSSTELTGADTDERGQCVARLDGSGVSLGYETTFDDITTNNKATVPVVATANNVAPGAHTVTINCNAINGTITKDDAAVNIIAVPNP